MTSPWLADPNAPSVPPNGKGGPRASSEILAILQKRFPVMDAESLASAWTELTIAMAGMFVFCPLSKRGRDNLLADVMEQVKRVNDDWTEFCAGLEDKG